MELQEALARHRAQDAEEARHLRRILEFVARHPQPFDRSLSEGHLTGSAFVLCETGERVLLLHHRKLARWLQPGGHADPGEREGEAVALREAEEETGIGGLRLHPRAPCPLDVDVHAIPASGAEPAHEHLDLRYLVLSPRDAEPSPRLAESRDLRWFTWREADALDLDPGLRRGLAKARAWTGVDSPGRWE